MFTKHFYNKYTITINNFYLSKNSYYYIVYNLNSTNLRY